MIRKLEAGEGRRYPRKITGAFLQIGMWSWRLLLALAIVVIAGRHSRGDDPKPSPPDVTAIIQATRQGEDLFRNIELAYTWEVIELPSGRQMCQEDHRVIRQGEWVHISSSLSQKDGAIPRTRQQVAYDGKMTRLAQYDNSGKHSLGQLTIGRGILDAVYSSPFTLGLPGQETLKLSATLDARSSERPDLFPRVVCKELEIINGLRAVKVEVKTNREQKDLWLAVDRHYIPVKMHGFSPGYDIDETLTEGTDWKEIEPGIIVPFQVVTTYFKKQDGKPTPHQRHIYKVTDISRTPGYDLAFFQDIPLAKGLPVTLWWDGKVLQRFVQPETGAMNIPPRPEEVPERAPRSAAGNQVPAVAVPSGTGEGWDWVGVAAGLVCVACLGAIYCIRKFRFQRLAR
jgi:hypothetical protein